VTDEGAMSTETSNRAAPRPNGTRAKAAAVLVAVFLLGALAGGAVGRVTAFREFNRVMEGPRSRSRLEALRRHLDLRDDQVPRVRAILDEAEAEREKLMGNCGPGLDELHKRTDARVREILDDEQKKRLDALEARRGHRKHGPWGGPPP
jgi:Spy/CpxP family protein refolding chaperone